MVGHHVALLLTSLKNFCHRVHGLISFVSIQLLYETTWRRLCLLLIFVDTGSQALCPYTIDALVALQRPDRQQKCTSHYEPGWRVI